MQNITVVADDVSNSLLITASPQVIEEVKPIIAQLDVMPPQVLIEAVVMEVTLDESTNLGLALSFDLPGGEGESTGGRHRSPASATAPFQAAFPLPSRP